MMSALMVWIWPGETVVMTAVSNVLLDSAGAEQLVGFAVAGPRFAAWRKHSQGQRMGTGSDS